MDYTILGRTGLRVSVMGVGGGGPSRLGKNTGRDESESVAVIRQALDAGVNFIDTAEGYRTEEIVGEAIAGVDRGSLVLSTKKSTSARTTPQDVEESIEDSLRRLGTDYVDIYHLHGVHPEEYDHLINDLSFGKEYKVKMLIAFSFAALLAALAVPHTGAVQVKREHPRIFVNKSELPELAKRCATDEIADKEYAAIKQQVDGFVDDRRAMNGRLLPSLCIVYQVEKTLGRDASKYVKYLKEGLWGTDGKGGGSALSARKLTGISP